MLDIAYLGIAYAFGLITMPTVKLVVMPYVKKKLRERWDETEDKPKSKRGRPKGSKNKNKKEDKEE